MPTKCTANVVRENIPRPDDNEKIEQQKRAEAQRLQQHQAAKRQRNVRDSKDGDGRPTAGASVTIPITFKLAG